MPDMSMRGAGGTRVPALSVTGQIVLWRSACALNVGEMAKGMEGDGFVRPQ